MALGGRSVQPSEGIRELVLSYHQFMLSGKGLKLEDYIAQHPATLWFGTGPDAWLVGYDRVLATLKIQQRQFGPTQIHLKHLLTLEGGELGYAVDRSVMEFSDGTCFPYRHSMVFVREEGVWRLVHSHSSADVLEF
jgi:hypothetical protein